jgi:hypothetical protein
VLDKTPEKTAWQRWLKDHVDYSIETTQNHMSVARLAKKNRKRLRFFSTWIRPFPKEPRTVTAAPFVASADPRRRAARGPAGSTRKPETP